MNERSTEKLLGWGVVNAVTKQGTNVFRGSAFAHATDKRWITEDFFVSQDDLAKPEAKKWQYGATLGGFVQLHQTAF